MEIKNMRSKKPEIRYLSEIKNVLYDKNWAKKTKDFPVYFIYRGIKKKNDLRYDITVIPAKKLGQEYNKTLGHEHINNYPELYQVLQGEAIYLLQKMKKNKKGQIIIQDIYAIKAKKGQIAIIPPGYGHVTINPGKEKLKMANWTSEKCQNDYRTFQKMQGAGYFYTLQGWIKNKNYTRVPKLKFKKPLTKIPKNLDFLVYASKN